MENARSYFNFKLTFKVLSIALLFFVVLFVSSFQALAVAGINRTINFQGKLVNNPAATNVTDTSYTVIFSLYDKTSGGTALWTETQTVTTADGIFRVALGSVTPIPASFNFNWDGIYLGMKVNSDAEMTPRVQLAAVPYAFNAEKVSGLTVQDTSGNASTSGTLRIANAKTINLGSDDLTFTTGGTTTLTLPTSGTLATLAGVEILTNKTIGSTGLTFSGAATDITTATNEDFTLTPNGSGKLILTSDFDSPVLVGSTSNTSAVLSVRGGFGSNAAFIVDQLNTAGNIISASASGTTKFTVDSNGVVTAAGGLTLTTGPITLGGVTGSGLCITGGATAAWGSCGAGGGTNWWDQVSGNGVSTGGYIAPFNKTADLLLGSIATTSAKFGFLNVLTGTPTASISGNSGTKALTLLGDGAIQTQQNNSLTLGGDKTGNIAISPNNGGAGSLLTLNTIAQTWSGTTAVTASSLATFTTAASLGVTATTLTLGNGSAATIATTTNGLTLDSGSNTLTIATSDTTLTASGLATFNTAATLSLSGDLTISGNDITNTTLNLGGGSAATIGTVSDDNLTIAANGTGNQIISSDFDSGTTIGTAITAEFPLLVRSGIGNNAALAIDNLNNGDLITASSSGTTKFTVDTNGNITTLGTTITAGSLATFTSSSSLTFAAAATTLGLGASSGTATINNAILALPNTTSITAANLSSFTSSASLTFAQAATTLNIGASTGTLNLGNGGNYTVSTTTNGNLTLTSAGTGKTILSSDFDSGVLIGSTADATQTPFIVSGGIANKALAIFNNTNNGNIIAASSSGTTKFTVDTNGVVTAAGGLTLTTGPITLGGVTGTGLCINGGASAAWGSCGAGGGGGSNWTLSTANGTLSPNNNTLDIFFGGTSTSSAKFAFINMVGAGEPTASIAGSITLRNGTGFINRLNGGDLSFQTSIGGDAGLTTKVTVKNNGFVGIGTTTPDALLSVSGAPAGKSLVTLNYTGTDQNIFVASAGGVRKFTLSGSGTAPVASISAQTSYAALVVNNSGVGDLLTASSSGLTRLVINRNGNVGIGNSLPTEKLEVGGGNIKIDAQANTKVAPALVSFSTPGTIVSGGTASIASVSASAVFNGSLYVGVTQTAKAEVYRYKANTGVWEVINTTAGTFATGCTGVACATTIDGVTSMAVFNGNLYIGTQKSNSAEVYRYNGGTGASVFTRVSNGITGPGVISVTADGNSIDGVSSMAVYGGKLYIGIREPIAANFYRYEGNVTWTKMSTTNGRIATATTVDAVSSMTVYNNALILGTKKAFSGEVAKYVGGVPAAPVTTLISVAGNVCGAGTLNSEIASLVTYNGRLYAGVYGDVGTSASVGQVCRYEDSVAGTSTAWTSVTSATTGTIRFGGTTGIDGIRSMTVYNGRLYIATSEPTKAEVYQYIDGVDWIQINGTGNGTAGTFASTASIDQGTALIPYNGRLYFGTAKSAAAEIYAYNNTTDQSYALKFNAASQTGGGEVNGLTNDASIWFMASPSGQVVSGQNTTGSFMLSHGIITGVGAYDVAEDYATRDTSLEPGDLVSIDPSEKAFVKKSSGANDYSVIGVYSENPALHLSQMDSTIDGANAIPVALAGRVPMKVNSQNGPIKAGDFIISSSTPGVGMKTAKSGNVIGQAMEPYDGEGIGKIMVYIKSSSYNGSIAESFVNLDVNSESFGEDILTALKSQENTGLTGSNIVTDRVIANIEMVSPKITVDTLFAKNIKADHIDGLDLITDRIASLETKIASLSEQPAASQSAVPVKSLEERLLDQLQASSSSATVTHNTISSNVFESDGVSINSGNLRVKGNGLFEGFLSVIDTITTNNFIVNGLSTFFGDVVFKAQVAFNGPVTFSSDAGGNALIAKDESRIEVKFDKQFEGTPIVNASVSFDEKKDEDGNITPSDEVEQNYFSQKYSYIIVNKSAKGFTIVLNKKAHDDVSFTWTALRVKDAKTIQSRLPESN